MRKNIDITKRKQAEEELCSHERIFSTMVENAPDMIVRFDTDLRHVFCNRAVEKRLGVPRNTFIGKTPLEIGGPLEQAKTIDKALRRTLETGEEQEVEQNFSLPSGTKRFLTRIVPERDDKGRIESLLAISIDITDRKLAEEALEQAEENFRRSMDDSPTGIRILNAVKT